MITEIWPRIMITVRIVLFIIALFFGAITLIVGAQSARAASAKNISIVRGDMLTLGDVFEGVEKNADYVLGPAPQPGKDMVLDARTLYRIATALKLDWKPVSSADQVVIRRAATVISKTDVETALRAALSSQPGINGKFSMSLNGTVDNIVLPEGSAQTIEIAAVNFDPSHDMFEAALVAPSAKQPLKRVNISGHIERIATIPVLRNALRNGDVINANDLDWIDIPTRSIQNTMLLDEKDVVGMTPRHVALAGKPLSANDLEQPKLVERGDTVMITFAEGPLILSTKGTALQSGAKGDIIRVNNINSNKTLDAHVTGSREVYVR
jgi:flagella basal body P-ring formation protein FlgA